MLLIGNATNGWTKSLHLYMCTFLDGIHIVFYMQELNMCYQQISLCETVEKQILSISDLSSFPTRTLNST